MEFIRLSCITDVIYTYICSIYVYTLHICIYRVSKRTSPKFLNANTDSELEGRATPAPYQFVSAKVRFSGDALCQEWA